jgi:hypothetical protein
MSTGWLIILAGYPLLAWLAYDLGANTYRLARHGVEKEALVTSLARTSVGGKGGATYYYNFKIDGVTSQHGFRTRLPVGHTVSVLTLPGDPDTIELGTRDSSLFELWSAQLGGPLMGFLALILFPFVLITAPRTLRALCVQRPWVGGQHHGR